MAIMKCKNPSDYIVFSCNGFTLIELLIALVIAGIITVAIYESFLTQQKSYIVQDQVAKMQQNSRAALYFMTREIRMAGYDPTEKAGATIINAMANTIHITMDLNQDGDCKDAGEDITYSLYYSNGRKNLGRKVGSGTNQPLAENIYNLEFYYILEDGSMTTNPGSTQFDQIRSVKVTILARAEQPDPNYTDTKTYITPSGSVWGPYNDGYRRRLLSTTIKCRNMGLH